MSDEHDNCALPLVRRVYALLGQDDSKVRTGDPLPRGWHFILFTPTAPQTIIGPDGTPVRQGESDAPADLPRRMMGGRRFAFFSDIPVGADVRRTSEVLSSAEKTGRSGRFMIRTTRQLIYVNGAKRAGAAGGQRHAISCASGGVIARVKAPRLNRNARRTCVSSRRSTRPCCSATPPAPSMHTASTTISPTRPQRKATLPLSSMPD